MTKSSNFIFSFLVDVFCKLPKNGYEIDVHDEVDWTWYVCTNNFMFERKFKTYTQAVFFAWLFFKFSRFVDLRVNDSSYWRETAAGKKRRPEKRVH